MYTLPTAPLSIGGILDDGFRLFRATWRQLLPIAIAAALIGAVPQLIIAGLGEIKPGEVPRFAALGAGAIATIVLFVFLSALGFSVMLAGVDRGARNSGPSLRETFAIGIRRAPAVIGTSLLVTLALMAGLVLLVIPGLYLMVALYPAFLLPITEQLGPRRSVGRAYSLVKGSWWRTAGVLSVMGLLLIALFAIVSVVAGFAMGPFIDSKDAQAAAGSLVAVQTVAALITAPFLPLTYCIMYAVYTDLRLRKDGGDLLERAATTRG